MAEVSHGIPRPEYPRPQFVREGWLNLNGKWQFEIDQGASGRARGLAEKELSGGILVPFCPESALSGVGNTDFMRAVWYRRTFEMPREALGKVVKINFGAVDYKAEVWLNGQSLGVHEGGYTSFSLDATKAAVPGENVIVVCAEDDTMSGVQPSGKQSPRYGSFGCFYTRTTGIWQTVWLEWMNPDHIFSVRLTPDAAANALHIRAKIAGGAGCVLSAESAFSGEDTGKGEAKVNAGWAEMTIPVSGGHYWRAGEGNLFDLRLTLKRDGGETDRLDSYFGLRSVGLSGKKFLLNGESVFQRLVLDQGFYPDGVYTAPTDADLKRDIELSMAMGFNGARLHEKVFEARFLYWADRLGYLCWGEMANWGFDHSDAANLYSYADQWLEAVERDYSAPCIIGWCPFNETWDVSGRRQNDEVLRTIYRMTKALDITRPVIDTSGNYHVETDIYDVHDYEQDPEAFSALYGPGTAPIHERMSDRQQYKGGPVFVSEYGGIGWNPGSDQGWGYGKGPKTEAEFLARYKGLTEALLMNPDHMGFCYTQLTDVEQEVNGLHDYHRRPKFDPAVIAAINRQKAAIED